MDILTTISSIAAGMYLGVIVSIGIFLASSNTLTLMVKEQHHHAKAIYRHCTFVGKKLTPCSYFYEMLNYSLKHAVLAIIILLGIYGYLFHLFQLPIMAIVAATVGIVCTSVFLNNRISSTLVKLVKNGEIHKLFIDDSLWIIDSSFYINNIRLGNGVGWHRLGKRGGDYTYMLGGIRQLVTQLKEKAKPSDVFMHGYNKPIVNSKEHFHVCYYLLTVQTDETLIVSIVENTGIRVPVDITGPTKATPLYTRNGVYEVPYELICENCWYGHRLYGSSFKAKMVRLDLKSIIDGDELSVTDLVTDHLMYMVEGGDRWPKLVDKLNDIKTNLVPNTSTIYTLPLKRNSLFYKLSDKKGVKTLDSHELIWQRALTNEELDLYKHTLSTYEKYLNPLLLLIPTKYGLVQFLGGKLILTTIELKTDESIKVDLVLDIVDAKHSLYRNGEKVFYFKYGSSVEHAIIRYYTDNVLTLAKDTVSALPDNQTEVFISHKPVMDGIVRINHSVVYGDNDINHYVESNAFRLSSILTHVQNFILEFVNIEADMDIKFSNLLLNTKYSLNDIVNYNFNDELKLYVEEVDGKPALVATLRYLENNCGGFVKISSSTILNVGYRMPLFAQNLVLQMVSKHIVSIKVGD